MTRARKKDVKEWRVIREPIPEFVDLEPVENSMILSPGLLLNTPKEVQMNVFVYPAPDDK